MYRRRGIVVDVLLVHPGGPFWAGKDAGSWSIPKGEVEPGEDRLSAARREFAEETGCDAMGACAPLTPRRQRSGKLIHAWAVEGTCEAVAAPRLTVAIEWPPRSGITRHFPEVDRVEWFDRTVARTKILPGQLAFLDELDVLLGSTPVTP
jgi:predicted NUDIX family NTP pyrophosphohydrolase